MDKVVFFVFDPSPRIERRIEDFVDAGFDVTVYGYRYDVVNVDYCNSPKYEYHVIETIPHAVSYKRRFTGLKKIKEIVKRFDRKQTVFYFFSLNVAAIAPFLNIKYIYEESDMLFDRFGKKILRNAVIAFNKHVIRKSAITVMTSEGFAQFYFDEKRPANIFFALNKVNTRCQELPAIDKPQYDENKIRFGFAGNIRYEATLNMARVIAKNYPQHEFHFFGNTESLTPEQMQVLSCSPNIFSHGYFKNPIDLPSVYAQMDFVVCTYDIEGVNPRYAEPNKLYEAMFFNTPIIVSHNTFLGDKVKKLGIGFAVDAFDEDEIKKLVDSLTKDCYTQLCESIKAIPKEESISDNRRLIKLVREL